MTIRKLPKVNIGEENGRGVLTAFPDWNYAALNIARGAPGKVRFVDKKFWFELTDENLAYMRRHFGQASVEDLLDSAAGTAVHERPPFATKAEPTELQSEAMRLSSSKKIFAFFLKPGSGKTKVFLDWAVRLWCEGKIDALLVVAPNFVHIQWIKDEIPKHIHPSIPYEAVEWKPGKKFKDEHILEPDFSKLRILSVGFESYISRSFMNVRNMFIRSGRVACVVDESQRIKTSDSQITQALTSHASMFEARAIGSGEPTPLGLRDYYSQYFFLDPGILNCFTFTAFKANFCVMGGYQNQQIVDYVNQDRLHELAAPYTIVGKPKIEVEQLWHDPWKFDLHPRTRDVYNRLRDDYIVQLETGELASVANQLAALIRLQQIATGRLILEDGTEERLPTDRPNVLKEMIKGISGKVIIWNEFRADVADQQEWLKDDAVTISGGVSREDRLAAKEAFLDHNGPRFLLATPGAAGTGLDGLQKVCHHAIYYTQRDNAGLRWQSEGRIYRLGAKHDAHYLDIVARATVDVSVQRRNRHKRANAQMSYNEFKSILENEHD